MSFLKNSPNVFKSESAQAMVEFIVVFPVFIVLVFGIIEFSFLSLVHQNVNYAAFTAARSKIVGLYPQLSAWIPLYMQTPHKIENLLPFVAIRKKYPILENPPTLRELIGLDNLGEEEADAEGFFSEMKETLLELVKTIAGTVCDYIQPGLNYLDTHIDEDSEKFPPFLRRVLYAHAFTDIDELEIADSDAPSMKVTVTYYYALKFPVIRTILSYFLRKAETLSERNDVLFSGTGSKWDRATILSDSSGFVFIPITHSCTLGYEQRMTK